MSGLLEPPSVAQREESINDEREGGAPRVATQPLLHLLKALAAFPDAASFLVPVSGEPGYYEAIKRPMDLRTVQRKLKSQVYTSVGQVPSPRPSRWPSHRRCPTRSRRARTQLYADLNLIWDNALEYNGQGHTVSAAAVRMRCHVSDLRERLALRLLVL